MTPRQDPEYLETVSLIAENAEQSATIASQAARIAELEAALKKTLDTLRIYSYTEYLDAEAARALLAKKG